MSTEEQVELLLKETHKEQGRRASQRGNLLSKRRKMTRRTNLIGIVGITCLCILLLIATNQHRPLYEKVISSSGGGAGLMSMTNSFSQEQQPSFTVQQQQQQQAHNANNKKGGHKYNMTATIDDVLAAKRERIVKSMENFEYPSGRFGVDAEKLSDLTPETGGMPVRSIIVTTWRSGSTFLGDILNSMPGNYYHYEPLLDFGINQVRGSDKGRQAVQNLKNLLKCEYSDMQPYLDYGRTHTYLFEHNSRLWAECERFPHFCWQSSFLTPFCKLFPLQSMKTVRLRLALAEELLKDKDLNVRIILLIRDPRGTLQSRKHRDWCPGHPDCDDPRLLCEDLVADYQSAVELLKKYPMQFRTIRYEDLSLNPYDMAQEILQFYGLPFDPLVEEFLDTHTKENVGGVSSTYRDSKSAPFHWKTDLKVDEIKNIQSNCVQAMELWGYRQIENFTDYQKDFDPIILPAPFS